MNKIVNKIVNKIKHKLQLTLNKLKAGGAPLATLENEKATSKDDKQDEKKYTKSPSPDRIALHPQGYRQRHRNRHHHRCSGGLPFRPLHYR